ncbi:isoprenylcysteine carboxylmethyltransferase family protein [Sphingobium sp. BYY-5]|uniref:methyltransferase family protein n=1 Tax=Sphingobium sp. BYY-5 TaxID=2926400 RepID=UPI001FA7ADDF|nr:isoprenylcysteine carboxylmethyltransferase family protein [Sphingobium sp. BYY-5]MCI4589846.1 isoprenylcysteine carboxylmethyltransferase family protein [Sphingobium sp. BYY-5]
MRSSPMLAQLLIRSLSGAVFMALLLFLPAGTWAWPQGWAYLLLFIGYSLATGLWLWKRDPQLLAGRMQSPLSSDQRPGDRMTFGVLLIVFCAWFIFIAFDARRYGWSHGPLWAQLVGAALLLWSFWGWTAVLRANSFAAVNVRVQGERDQTVISTGPYAAVRHPMYAYCIPYAIGTPLMLGSLWGLLGLIPFLAIIVIRLIGEETVLREGLAGYSDYAAKVRFRLLPGIW